MSVTVIWVVDKKVVSHLVQRSGLLAEIPLRVSFEYAVDAQAVVPDSLSIKVLYNSRSVCKHFPDIPEDKIKRDVQKTASEAVREHLALNGFATPADEGDPVVVAVH